MASPPKEQRVAILETAEIQDTQLRRVFETPDPPTGSSLMPNRKKPAYDHDGPYDSRDKWLDVGGSQFPGGDHSESVRSDSATLCCGIKERQRRPGATALTDGQAVGPVAELLQPGIPGDAAEPRRIAGELVDAEAQQTAAMRDSLHGWVTRPTW